MCKTQTPTMMPVGGSTPPDLASMGSMDAPPMPGAAVDPTKLFGAPQDTQVEVNKPTKFGRALEIGTGGMYDPTGGADTNPGPGMKPTKFGSLLNILRPMMTGAVIGGLTGRSTPGGGFAGANNFFMQQRLRNMQASQFMMEMAQKNSEMQKNAAEAGYYNRGGATRIGQPVIGKNGNYWQVDPVTRELVDTGVEAKGKDDTGPDYSTVSTDKGIVEYDKKGKQPTIPLTLANAANAVKNNGTAASASEPSDRINGPSDLLEGVTVPSTGSVPQKAANMGTPRVPGSAGAVNPSPGNIPLMPSGTNKPKPTRVTNRNAAGVETDSLIDENPNSPTFGQPVGNGKPLATRQPVPNKTDENQNKKNDVSARIENYADEALRQSNGDPDKALAFLDTITGKIGDKKAAQEYAGMLPQIRARIREKVKPGRTGKKPRISPDEATSMGLQPAGQASMTDEDEQ